MLRALRFLLALGLALAFSAPAFAQFDGSPGSRPRVGSVGAARIAGAPVGMFLREKHTAVASAELDFTSCLSGQYDDYMILFDTLVPTTNLVGLRMQMSTTGGASYDTGANYYYNTGAAGAGYALDAAANTTFIEMTYASTANAGNSALYGVDGQVFMRGVNNTSAYTKVLGQSNYFDGTSVQVSNIVNGNYKVTSVVNAFRLLFSSGTIASGTAYCYAYAKQ